MSFIEGTDEFECIDCGIDIDLNRYRRKVPRCDDCEVIEAMLTFDQELNEILGDK
jgi:hypothetical protein